MSVYIRGMEMPKKCISCPFCSYGLCVANKGKELGSIQRRDDDCPLIPVPDHGRLIDADALIGTIRPLCEEDKFAACTFETVKRLMAEHINNAPTIIPADKEGK